MDVVRTYSVVPQGAVVQQLAIKPIIRLEADLLVPVPPLKGFLI